MGHHVDSFHLVIDAQSFLVKRPRLWRLIIGVACIPLTFSFFWLEPVNAYWTSKHLGNPHTIGIIFLILGIYGIATAFINDFFQAHEALFTNEGIDLLWTNTPHLLSLRVANKKHFNWNDFEDFHWHESNSDHDLQQHIKIKFKQSIFSNRNFLKLRVSDDRNYERCEKLISILPKNFLPPAWVLAERKRKEKILAPKGSVFENLPVYL